MNTKTTTRLAIILGALLVVYFIAYLTVTSPVTVLVAADSPVQSPASLTSDSDGFKQSSTLPTTLKLHSGRHRLVITPTDKLLAVSEENIRVWPFTHKTVSVQLEKGELPGARGAAENPYLKYFPHETGDYRLEAILSADMTTVEAIKLTVLHRFAEPSNPTAYQGEHDNAVNEAKDYLHTNAIPETIPITITDL